MLAALLAEYGVRHAVISPGSRNAPLIMAFNRQKEITCLSIPDERSAAFFALGMAQQLCNPVALICTSGTAALNYSPAIAEAYYQHVPLIVITADRPAEWIDQQDGQAIRQENMYRNFIKKSFSLPVDMLTETDMRLCERIISEAYHISIYPAPGPVHVNVPLREPLYGQTKGNEVIAHKIQYLSPTLEIDQTAQKELAKIWNSYNKKMIITGMLFPCEPLNIMVNQLAGQDDVVVLTETTSNLRGKKLHPCIDRLIAGISNFEDYRPELLVTIGGPLISRKIKNLLRKFKPAEHWHVSPAEPYVDAYLSLTKSIPVEPLTFLKCITKDSKPAKSAFAEIYDQLELKTTRKHNEYLETVPFSDLKVFQSIFTHIPQNGMLQLGNSTPVRYAQLFRHENSAMHFSNRGTSGIDGCCSTAAGAAYVTGEPATIITGDVGFFYDSNFLWNNYLSKDLRIIIINNCGGGIFRFIDGPDTVEELDPFIETPHGLNSGQMARTFGIPYFVCEEEGSLGNTLREFYKPSGSALILEIKTPRFLNGKVLKSYFEYLKD